MTNATGLTVIGTQLNAMTAFARTPHDPAAWRGVQSNVLGPMGIACPGGVSAYRAPSATRDLATFRDRVLNDVRPHLNGSLVRCARSLSAGEQTIERPVEFVRLLNDARDLNVVSSNPAQAMLISAQMIHPELRGMVETPEEGNADFLQYAPLACIAFLVSRFFFDYPDSLLVDAISIFGLLCALSMGIALFSKSGEASYVGQAGDVVNWKDGWGQIKIYGYSVIGNHRAGRSIDGGLVIKACGPADLKPGDKITVVKQTSPFSILRNKPYVLTVKKKEPDAY